MRLIGLAVVLALSLMLAPLAVEAQQAGRVYQIGLLSVEYQREIDAFRRALRDLGYVEGQNLLLAERYADGKFERLPQLAAELVHLNADVLVTWGTPATLAARNATPTIPIVFGGVGDPVAAGIVRSIARPGGNATGTTTTNPEISGKRLSLLKEASPKLVRVAILTNPTFPTTPTMVAETQSAAKALALQATAFEGTKRGIGHADARDSSQLDRAFRAMRSARSEGVVVLPDPIFVAQRRQIVKLAAESRIPAIYHLTLFLEAGGLMSYGASYADLPRRYAYFVDKILKGAKPADLPVEQPTKFELAINLKTAKALGLTIPQTLLLRADQVIE